MRPLGGVDDHEGLDPQAKRLQVPELARCLRIQRMKRAELTTHVRVVNYEHFLDLKITLDQNILNAYQLTHSKLGPMLRSSENIQSTRHY